MRDIEKAIYQQSLADMRTMVDTEVDDMCELVGVERSELHPHHDSHVNPSDDNIDYEALKLRLGGEAVPAIPVRYLEGTVEEEDTR